MQPAPIGNPNAQGHIVTGQHPNRVIIERVAPPPTASPPNPAKPHVRVEPARQPLPIMLKHQVNGSKGILHIPHKKEIGNAHRYTPKSKHNPAKYIGSRQMRYGQPTPI
jgi:hypothetical protein